MDELAKLEAACKAAEEQLREAQHTLLIAKGVKRKAQEQAAAAAAAYQAYLKAEQAAGRRPTQKVG